MGMDNALQPLNKRPPRRYLAFSSGVASILTRLRQSANTSLPYASIEGGSSTSSRLVHPLINLCPMSTFVSMLMSSRFSEVHPSKQSSPKKVTDGGSSTSSRLVHPLINP